MTSLQSVAPTERADLPSTIVWTDGTRALARCPSRDSLEGPVEYLPHPRMVCHPRKNPVMQLQRSVSSIAPCLSVLDTDSFAEIEVEVSGSRVTTLHLRRWSGDPAIVICVRWLSRIEVDHRACSWTTVVTLAHDRRDPEATTDRSAR